MRIKKNKIVIFYFFNIILLLVLLLLTIPASKFLRKINFEENEEDNEFVKNQVIINPEEKTTKIIVRKITIK